MFCQLNLLFVAFLVSGAPHGIVKAPCCVSCAISSESCVLPNLSVFVHLQDLVLLYKPYLLDRVWIDHQPSGQLECGLHTCIRRGPACLHSSAHPVWVSQRNDWLDRSYPVCLGVHQLDFDLCCAVSAELSEALKLCGAFAELA